jgi:hypothetical protein
MTVLAYILGIIAASIVLLVVAEMLRNRRLRERHALWWIFAGLTGLVIAIFPATLEWTAGAVGIAVPANLVFFLSIMVLFFVCLQHSSELTTLEEKTRRLAEEVALQDKRIRDLEKALGARASDH